MKIRLSELRQLVKRVIKEENGPEDAVKTYSSPLKINVYYDKSAETPMNVPMSNITGQYYVKKESYMPNGSVMIETTDPSITFLANTSNKTLYYEDKFGGKRLVYAKTASNADYATILVETFKKMYPANSGGTQRVQSGLYFTAAAEQLKGSQIRLYKDEANTNEYGVRKILKVIPKDGSVEIYFEFFEEPFIYKCQNSIEYKGKLSNPVGSVNYFYNKALIDDLKRDFCVKNASGKSVINIGKYSSTTSNAPVNVAEIRKIVKRVIKEENEENPEEILNKEFKVLHGNFNNTVLANKDLKEYLKNIGTEKYSEFSNNLIKRYNALYNKYVYMIKEEFKGYSGISQTVPLMKIRLPEILQIALGIFSDLKRIFEISDDDTLDMYIKKMQYALLPFKMSIDRFMEAIPAVEATLPPSETNVPQQQTNVPQQQNNVPQQQGSSQLKNELNELKDNVRSFSNGFKTLTYKYIDDILSERMFSDSANNLLMPIENTISSILNSNLSENYLHRIKRSKKFLFENSIKETVINNYFEENIIRLNTISNSLDASIGIEAIKSKLSAMNSIIREIKNDLNNLRNNPL